MADYIPPIQLPQGLAAETIRLAAQGNLGSQLGPALAQGLSSLGEGIGQRIASQKQAALQPTWEQLVASKRIDSTMNQPLPPGQAGPPQLVSTKEIYAPGGKMNPLLAANFEKEYQEKLSTEKLLAGIHAKTEPNQIPATKEFNEAWLKKYKFKSPYTDGVPVPKSTYEEVLGAIAGNVNIGEKHSQYTQKRLTALGDALDPSKGARGPLAVSKQVFDRAERLETLASAFPDGNLDSRQIEELAIGLNAMLSGSNVGAQSQVKALVPDTIRGNAMKFAEWLTNDPKGTKQQAFVSRMMGTITREKDAASDQIKRTQFQRIGRYQDLEKSAPDDFLNVIQHAGIEPDEYKEWKKSGFKPMSAVQGPESGHSTQGQSSTIKVNPKTGEKVQWNGTNWVKIQ